MNFTIELTLEEMLLLDQRVKSSVLFHFYKYMYNNCQTDLVCCFESFLVLFAFVMYCVAFAVIWFASPPQHEQGNSISCISKSELPCRSVYAALAFSNLTSANGDHTSVRTPTQTDK